MSTVQWVSMVMIVAMAMMLLIGLAQTRADQVAPVPVRVDGQASDEADR